ncbi:MAG: [FeFe] hydrogenase H-cluster radical SAM maturase HydE [Clostridia bacterium]|nr:[FeFe] hydrogenase H-cluster radical SAM maturase HydE [Clostridia bacterium]
MGASAEALAEKLIADGRLEREEYAPLIDGRTPGIGELLRREAVRLRNEVYGARVFIRGLIEISSSCRNDCLYCGLRRSNKNCERYRLSAEEIIACADEGYGLGFRTFVLQGGEDPALTDGFVCGAVAEIKRRHPDCAVTLSLGERSRESFERLRAAGADRYLLRHETADAAHYARLHPPEMSFDNRLRCLKDLREIGFAVGAGMMVGSPYQTPECLASDLAFIGDFRPEMCGIGPFIPHRDTPFAGFPAGSAELTCFLLSVIRVICPTVLLPATTALGTIHPRGRELGIEHGANVVMPNLSPIAVRKKYELYDNKICTGEESAQCLECLGDRISSAGCEIVVDRGDPVKPFCG